MKWLIAPLLVLLVCLQVVPAQAAITFVGAQVGSFAGVTTAQTINFALTGGSDATPQAGDFVIASYCVSANADRGLLIQDAGANAYTLVGTEQYRDDAFDANQRTAYKVMSGTPDTDIVLSEGVNGGTGDVTFGGAYAIFVFRGVHATPLEQAVQQGTGVDTILINPGGITPATAGTFIYVSGCGAISTGGVYTQGDLTNFISATAVDNNDANIGAGYLAWAAGAYNPATYAGGGTDSINSSYTWMIVALAPAAVAGSTCNGGMPLLRVGTGC